MCESAAKKVEKFDRSFRAVKNTTMESKENFKQRLINEKRWDEFVAYREDLKAKGVSAKEAWVQGRAKFDQPIDIAGVPAVDSGGGAVIPDRVSVQLDIFQNKPTASARQIVQWVFDSIDIEDCKPEDAPSAGAWSFLQRVRTYPDLLKEFYRSIWSRMLPNKSEIEALEKFEDDGRDQIHLIDQILRAKDKANG